MRTYLKLILAIYSFLGILTLHTDINIYAMSVADVSNGKLYTTTTDDGIIGLNSAFTFSVNNITGNYYSTAYISAAVDIDGIPGISNDEWIIKNIPVNLNNGLISQPSIIIPFDSGSYSISENAVYDTYVTIQDSEIINCSGYLTWTHSALATGAIEWTPSPLTESIEADNSPPIPPSEVPDSYGPYRHFPDIDQRENECAPTSIAMSLRWLQSRNPELGITLPDNDDALIGDILSEIQKINPPDRETAVNPSFVLNGKNRYVTKNSLPIETKGGPSSSQGAKGRDAFAFIKNELREREDIELVVSSGGLLAKYHMVNVVGFAEKDNDFYLYVVDHDDKINGVSIWKVNRLGKIVDVVNGNQSLMDWRIAWAMSESPKRTPPATPPPKGPKEKSNEGEASYDSNSKTLSFSNDIVVSTGLFDGTNFSTDSILGAGISIPTLTLKEQELAEGKIIFRNETMEQLSIQLGGDIFLTADLGQLEYIVDENLFYWVLEDIKLSGVDSSSPFYDPSMPILESDYIAALESILNPSSVSFTSGVQPYFMIKPLVNVYEETSAWTESDTFTYEDYTGTYYPIPEPATILLLSCALIGFSSYKKCIQVKK